PDRAREVLPQGGVVLLDAVNRVRDAALDVDARAFGGGSGAAHATSEPDGAPELGAERVRFGASSREPCRIVPRFCFRELFFELDEPPAVGSARGVIQELT